MSSILPTKAHQPKRSFSQWLFQTFERDYFPSLDPYIAWLREPVGWFILATAASILVGVTLSPIALSVAAGLMGLLFLGLAYPWLAVRLTSCELISALTEIAEDEPHDVQVRVRNRCPWPLWGLIIEGFVVSPLDEDELEQDAQPSADIALSAVAWLSQATYRLSIQPRLRGRYPQRVPQLTCAFPFGLWTARRAIDNATPLVVQPRQIKLQNQVEQAGRASHHGGTGMRSGGHADFLGIRDFRQGDSTRHIHWAHTARLDAIVVCERSVAEQSPWQIVLDARTSGTSRLTNRENLAWRVRIAASLCTMLYQQAVPFQLVIYGEDTWSRETQTHRESNREGNRLVQAIDRLTDVPIDGVSPEETSAIDPLASTACAIVIQQADDDDPAASSGDNGHLIRLRLLRATGNLRQTNDACAAIINLNQAIAVQINAWLQKVSHGRQAA